MGGRKDEMTPEQYARKKQRERDRYWANPEAAKAKERARKERRNQAGLCATGGCPNLKGHNGGRKWAYCYSCWWKYWGSKRSEAYSEVVEEVIANCSCPFCSWIDATFWRAS